MIKYALLNKNKNKNKIKKALYIIMFFIIFIWSSLSIGFNFSKLQKGWGGIVDIIFRMFPPDISIFKNMIVPTIETIQISIVGTVIAIILSIPLGFLAASNITPNSFFYHVSRFILNFVRAVPDMVFALIFVAAIGLGPFPGTLAIGISSSGMLGKLLADSIENVDQGPIDALQSTGANNIQKIIYGIVPQILPEFISVSLFRWEMNFRASAILGIVGAGGLGFEIITSMRLFNYREMTVILLIILILVALVDTLSNQIRKRII